MLDVAAHLGDRLHDAAPLGGGSPTSLVVGLGGQAPSAASPDRSRSRARRRPARPRRSIRPGPGRGSWSSASSKRRAARASRCSTASCACGPEARISTSWPSRAPRVATRLRLPAGTGPAPVVRLRQRDGGVEPAHLADQPGGRPRVQAVLVGHREAPTTSSPRGRAAPRRDLVGAGQVRRLAHQRARAPRRRPRPGSRRPRPRRRRR